MKGGKRNGAGRPQGSKNKTQEQIREYFHQLLSDNMEQLSVDLQSLRPEQRIKVLLELSKFVLPQLKAIEHTTSDDPAFNTIVIQYAEGINPL